MRYFVIISSISISNQYAYDDDDDDDDERVFVLVSFAECYNEIARVWNYTAALRTFLLSTIFLDGTHYYYHWFVRFALHGTSILYYCIGHKIGMCGSMYVCVSACTDVIVSKNLYEWSKRNKSLSGQKPGDWTYIHIFVWSSV